MSLALAHEMAPLSQLPTAPAQMAGELLEALRIAETALGHGKIDMIAKLLNYAATAEQQLAEQQERIAQLEALTETDELTGALNRRGFQGALARTLHNAARHDEQGLVAYLDLDGFKAVNDTHGHEAGDHVLKLVTATLGDMVRSTDYVARLGGDEFALILVRSEIRHGRARIQQIQPALDTLTVTYKGAVLPVRASIGMIPYGPESEAETLVRGADMAMYRAKARRKAAA